MAAKPSRSTVKKSAQKPAARPARPAAKPAAKSAAKSAAKPAAKSAAKPVAKAAAKSAKKAAPKRAAKPAVKPVARTTRKSDAATTATGKTAPKKAIAKKAAAKNVVAKKTVTKKATVKKAVAKKTVATKKATAKKAVVTKAVAKKSVVNQPVVKQAAIEPGSALDAAHKAAAILFAKKAEDVVLMDLRDLSTVADYYLIATCTNEPQMRTILGTLQRALSREGIKSLRSEYVPGVRWAVVDYGDLIVHVFEKQTRGFYSLERLWADAPSTSLKAGDYTLPVDDDEMDLDEDGDL